MGGFLVGEKVFFFVWGDDGCEVIFVGVLGLRIS